MKLLTLVLSFTLVVISKGQVPIRNHDVPPSMSATILEDSNRKDWSLLDRVYLIAKTIHPEAIILPKGDTLMVGFDIPGWLADSSKIAVSASYCYETIALAFNRDSMKYKTVGIALCPDSLTCYYSYFDVRKYKYLKRSLSDQIMTLFRIIMWPSISIEFTGYRKKETLIFRHHIDNASLYASPYYIRLFYQAVSSITGDLIFKRGPKFSNKYEDLLVIFSDGVTPVYYWRFPLSKELFKSLYRIKFYESYIIVRDSQGL